MENKNSLYYTASLDWNLNNESNIRNLKLINLQIVRFSTGCISDKMNYVHFAKMY